jgi:hypothetical protein
MRITRLHNIRLIGANIFQEYRFGTMNFPHGFCSNCGSSMYARADGGKYGGIMAINVSFLNQYEIGICILMIDRHGL